MSDASGRPTRAATAPDEVYLHLKRMILDGALKGGERVNVIAVARALQVSRMPIREALRRLDSDGLVTIRPNRGAVVTRLTPEEVRELFEIRSALEGLAARHAVASLTPDVLDELELMRRRMDRAAGDPKLWIERHDALHERICSLSGRPRLCVEIRRVREAVHPYLLMYIDLYAGPEMFGHEHQALLRVLARRDAQAAERMMQAHIMNAADGLIRFLSGKMPNRRGERLRANGAPRHGPTQMMQASKRRKR